MPEQKNQGSPPASQPDKDNRSQQLNEQDPTYHRSRGESEPDSASAARQATQQNQQKK
ncbi:hypothetical protein [Pyxidicoccus xibeiensis]|uniref:hypothetical protein n=1 Tax=Pyxidicoccus xibeiensis TaxID=2906759 RepID=UPI0020A76D5B|nr:hypothetical protein [Pyxidicoccus xibeiensis]MCP3140252.1 hypothetical protein [Pyxidicoccus xibeiensis]